MDTNTAFEAAAAGKKIKREAWPAGKYLAVVNGRKMIYEPGKDADYYKLEDGKDQKGKKVLNPDRHAKDWKIYEDEIPAAEENKTDGDKLSASFVNNKKETKSQTK
ncbi:MAG: hypothetical protein ACQUYJ_13655 [Ferruginibacter sp.]